MVATKSILAKRDLSKRDLSKRDRPRKRPPVSAPRREGVVDRVRDEGQPDHHEDQRRAREEPQPPGYPQETLRVAWWLWFFPGAALILVVIGLTLVADAINDSLPPRR